MRRARRHALRGEQRQAMLAIKEACFLADQNPRLWALYGVHCWRARRHDDAVDALRQAIWLRERESDTKRAGALKNVLAAVQAGRQPGDVIAA